jgi:hypothetical protein
MYRGVSVVFVSVCLLCGVDFQAESCTNLVTGPIHDQSCCAKLFCATQVCPFTIKSISTIHDQSYCTTRSVAQHDWLCMGHLTVSQVRNQHQAGSKKYRTLLHASKVKHAVYLTEINISKFVEKHESTFYAQYDFSVSSYVFRDNWAKGNDRSRIIAVCIHFLTCSFWKETKKIILETVQGSWPEISFNIGYVYAN